MPLGDIPQLTPLGGYISREMRQRLSAVSSLAALPPRRAHEETGSDAANTAAAADAAVVAEAESAMSATVPAKAVAFAAPPAAPPAVPPAAAPAAALAVSSSAPALLQRRKGKMLASQGGGSMHRKMLSFGEVVKEAHAMQAKLRAALAQSSESVVELFQQWDTDGNGKVTRADFES